MKTLFKAFALALVALSAKALPASRTYNQPKFNSYRLDWCREWTQNCGQPAADAFCVYKGFLYADEYAKDEDVQETTMVIGDYSLCDASFCDSFQYIRCRDPRYEMPYFQGYRLDWCKNFASDCGQPAADEFCEYQGHAYASSFEKDEDVGETTIVIGDLYQDDSWWLCTESYCDGFTNIYCSGQSR